ncbi:agmatinase family protein [Robertmurraya sp. DFI.2.37]|uniref:agmatinase family protein n=1 Tax=Robertmurraya sp. DFI.2.37 TaxID=3031819 RepID=UPI001245EABF|nr:agmatinase family protein [Robertmurraya sp. DFI.2.37]MDF1509322.1 agmatinase family protein [Robertmurraya sp. DFI.2.37]
MNGHWLHSPEWKWTNNSTVDKQFVHQWVVPLEEISSYPDVVLYGAPISRSSISVSGASQYPDEFRKMWKKFATYQIEKNIDLTSLNVADAGDVQMHTTDILLSHERIEAATSYIVKKYARSVTSLIGGDHSVTACAIRGIKEQYPEEKIGILQLDTHLDVRDPRELGPANGTPIRQLIDGKVVEGRHIINIGLHGFFNAKSLVDYAREKEIKLIPLNEARNRGLVHTIKRSIEYLETEVDRIYVTVDMDVLDISVAPGVPASTPGGMNSQELFDILFEIGTHQEVNHIDFVCLDPTKDSIVAETVKIGVYAWLQYLSGVAVRKLT